MKTKEELNALKKEVEALNAKLAELSEEELKEVTGGKKDYTIPEDETKYVGFGGSNCYTRDPDVKADRPRHNACKTCGVYSFCRNKHKDKYYFMCHPDKP